MVRLMNRMRAPFTKAEEEKEAAAAVAVSEEVVLLREIRDSLKR